MASDPNVSASSALSADNSIPGVRALAAWEIASVSASVLIAEWILSAAAGRSKLIVAAPISLAFTFIILSQLLHGESLRDLGFRFDNFFRALKLLLLPMATVAAIALLVAFLTGTRPDFFRWHSDRPIAAQFLLGIGWGFVQQYVLQSFMNRRAQLVWGRGVISVLVTALIFAVLHFPNPWLMVVTFVGGLVWAFVFQRAPNLFALAVSHSVMTWLLVSALPVSALHHLRIGFKYFV
jgi:membrane protease YdiL (CAAX protease family)